MAKLYPKVLFFINGTTPTAEQLAMANDYGPGVAFRNANMIVDDAPIEDADAVTGEVPARYADALPDVGDRQAVFDRLSARDPNRETMFQRERSAVPYSQLSDEVKAAQNAEYLARGEKPAPVNERVSQPRAVGDRMSQSARSNPPLVAGDPNAWSGGGVTAADAGTEAGPAEGTGSAGSSPTGTAADATGSATLTDEQITANAKAARERSGEAPQGSKSAAPAAPKSK